MEHQRRHLQSGWAETWIESRGTRGIALDGDDLCSEVLHGQLIVSRVGTKKEEKTTTDRRLCFCWVLSQSCCCPLYPVKTEEPPVYVGVLAAKTHTFTASNRDIKSNI